MKGGATPLSPEFPLSLSKGTSPPNTTMKIWDTDFMINSSDLPPPLRFGGASRGENWR